MRRFSKIESTCMGRIDYKDAVYEGDVFVSGGRKYEHGNGVLKYHNGKETYHGHFNMGKFDGYGELSFVRDPNDKRNQVAFVKGIFRAGDIVDGTITFEDGTAIEGKFDKNRVPIGEAKYYYSDGSYACGQIRKIDHSYSLYLGSGRHSLYYSDGSLCYEGFFNADNRFDSVGTYHYKNGDYYKGIFRNGKFHDVGTYFDCVDKEKGFYIEMPGHFRDGKMIKASIVFDEGKVLDIGRVNGRYDAFAKATLPSIRKFISLPEDTDVYTKDYAVMKRTAERLLADNPKLMKAFIDWYSFSYMQSRFQSRLKVIDDHISFDFKINRKIDLIWHCIFWYADDEFYYQLVDAVGSEKETTEIFEKLCYDSISLKEFIPFKTCFGTLIDHQPKEKPKKEIGPSLKDKKYVYSYPYPIKDLTLRKKKSSKDLELKFSLFRWGYIVKGIGSCRDENIVFPPYDDEARFSVKIIEKEAFMFNKNIVSIDLTNFMTVEHHAFFRCRNLKTIYIGLFTKVAPTAFESLFNLEEIIYAGDKKQWKYYQAREEWLSHINSQYQVVIHCSDGDILLKE